MKAYQWCHVLTTGMGIATALTSMFGVKPYFSAPATLFFFVAWGVLLAIHQRRAKGG